MAKKVVEQTIEIQEIKPIKIIVSIEGDTDLVLHKMNDVTKRKLTKERKDQAKELEKPNVWEEIITSIHWLKGKPKEFSEESFIEALKNNAPCLTSFGFKSSFGQAVVRNQIATYATKFNSQVNVGTGNGLIPINFTEHYLDEELMSPQKGSPVLTRLHRFTGWSAEVPISILNNVYSVEQVVNIVNLAGFGLGIGSSRPSGFGRYHVTNVRVE